MFRLLSKFSRPGSGGERAGPVVNLTLAGTAGCRPEPAVQVEILEVNPCYLFCRYPCPNY